MSIMIVNCTRPGEVKHDALLIGPQIKVARDELGTLIEAEVPDGLERAKAQTLVENANTLGFIEKSVEQRIPT